MPEQLRLWLGVYRDLSNRREDEPDNGPMARAAHEKRRQALEADLNDPCFAVVDWGTTKDQEPHEFVQIIIDVMTGPGAQAAAAAGLAFIGGILSKAFSSVLVDGTRRLIEKLVPRV